MKEEIHGTWMYSYNQRPYFKFKIKLVKQKAWILFSLYSGEKYKCSEKTIPW